MKNNRPHRTKPVAAPTQAQIQALVALYNQGQYTEVEKKARQLTVRFPKYGFGWKLLGGALQGLGRLAESVEIKQKSVALTPNDAEAFYNLGNGLKKLGRLDEAEACYKKAIALKPQDAGSYYNLGLTLEALGRTHEAESYYRTVISLTPQHVEAHNNLGVVLNDQSRLEEAESCYRTALALNPNYMEAHCNLGVVLKDQGRLQESEASYRQALALNPQHLRVYSSLFVSLNYSDHYSREFCLQEAKQFGALATQQASNKLTSWLCEPQPERLRIGFVSGDFCDHVVSHFLENLLAQLGNSRLDLFAYPSFLKTDEVTERIKGYFTAWQPIASLTDMEAAQLIHQDKLHILVDLSGHTAKNRLPLFAYQAAPVQVTWLGYWATTGVAEIDYILVDKVGVPEQHQAHFSEQLFYLPETRLCFSAPKFAIPVTPLPALSNGFVTFGCFQNLSKVTDAVLSVWGKILARIPAAQLRFQSKQLGDKKFIALFYDRLARFGIHPAQVSLHSASSRPEYLAAHSAVDFILDTFPYTGGTTTCEALWMGVPTLTLAGETLLARQGASLLAAAGLSDWIVETEENYIAQAIAFAADLDALATLRQGLREQVLASPLFDAPRFAHHFEQAMWTMWQNSHCGVVS